MAAKKSASKKKATKPKAKAVKRTAAAVGSSLITSPTGGDQPDVKGLNECVLVTCTLVLAIHDAARVRCFDPAEAVTAATGASDGYTAMSTPSTTDGTCSGDVQVENIHVSVAPTVNNNKLVAFAHNLTANVWDPIGTVYVAVFDSTNPLPTSKK